VDLAGFPKDAYYMYQSEWTDTPVLHVLPHWNWNAGDTVDVWAYTNCDSVELFLNGTSYGTKAKAADDLHLAWDVPFAAGALKAVGHRAGKEPLVHEVKTAGAPANIMLEADRSLIRADGRDLAFITVKVLDDAGIVVPHADNLVTFEVIGEGRLVGVDNGLQTSHEPFNVSYRKAFNGICLAVIESGETAGNITVRARSAGLREASVEIVSRSAQ
jgi:beta-galactosidase